MKRMRKTLAAGVTGALLIAASYDPANADVPVVDFAALGQWVTSIGQQEKAYLTQIQQYLTQAKQYVGEQLSWATQAHQYATQLQQYENQLQTYLNFYHNPTLGAAMGVLNGTGLGGGLPVSPYAVMGLLNGAQYSSGGVPAITGVLNTLSGFTNSAYSSSHVYTPTDASWHSHETIANANGIAGAQGASQQSYADLVAHQGALQPLRDNLLASKDTKGVLDATGQINTEIAWNVNALAKQQAITAAYEAAKDSRVQRSDEKISQDIEGFLVAAPPD